MNERAALRLVAKKDRKGLEAMRDVALAGLAALDAFEGVRPATPPPAPGAEPQLTKRQLAGKAAAEARWHPERIANASALASATHANGTAIASQSHAVGIGSASARHAGGDKEGVSDLSVSPEKPTENPEKYRAHDACASDANADAMAPADRMRLQLQTDFEGVLDAWGEGIRAVTGKPVTRPNWRARGQLIDVVVAHAVAEADPRAWLRGKVESFARSFDPTYGGWTPTTFAKWLDSNEPSGPKGRPAGGRTPHIIQRHNAPELVTESLLEVGNG